MSREVNGKAIQRETRLKHELFNLQDVQREQEKTIQETKGKCAALKNEIKNLQQSISRKTAKNTELSKKLESEKKLNRDANQKIKEYHQLVQILEDECHQARETNVQLLAEIKEENSKLKKENQGLSRALTRKHQQLETVDSELRNSVKRQQESENEVVSLMRLLQRNQSDSLQTGEQSNECPICFSEYEAGNHQLSCFSACGHMSCSSCIQKILSNQSKCPFCNCDKKSQRIIKLYHA